MTHAQRPFIEYISHFLIAIGVLFIGIFVFSIIGYELSLAIFDVDAREMLEMDNQIELNSTNVSAVRLYLGIVSFGGFLLTSLIIIKSFRKNIMSFTGLGTPPKIENILIAVGVIIAAVPVVDWLIAVNGQISLPEGIGSFLDKQEQLSNFTYDVMLTGNTGGIFILNVFLVALIPALGEELFFRGIMQRIFTSWANNHHIGIIVSGLMFATLHAQILKIIPMFMMGVMFGYAYYLTGSLWVPIVLHFLNNAIAVTADSLMETGRSLPPLTGEVDIPAYAAGIGLVIIVGFFYLMHRVNPEPQDLHMHVGDEELKEIE